MMCLSERGESCLDAGRVCSGQVGGGGVGDLSISVVPEEATKRSKEELRELWRKAILQQILLQRMERENQKLQGSFTHRIYTYTCTLVPLHIFLAERPCEDFTSKSEVVSFFINLPVHNPGLKMRLDISSCHFSASLVWLVCLERTHINLRQVDCMSLRRHYAP